MNDRLRIAAMNVTAMLANDKWQTWAPILISRNAVVMADALLAAAGEKESVSIMSQPVSRIEYDKQVARAYAAEGIVDDLKAQLTAALEDNERMRGGALNVAYGNMFARAEAAEAEAQRLRDLVESGAVEVAALKRQMEPLTEREAMIALSDVSPLRAHSSIERTIAACAVCDLIRARRVE